MKIERDDARQRIVATAEAAMSLADLRAVMDQQHADGTWHYAVLFDGSNATASITGAQMRSLADHIDSLRPAARGPVAVVASDPALYGMARMYQTMTERTGLRFAVFHSRAQAEQWLDAQQGPNP